MWGPDLPWCKGCSAGSAPPVLQTQFPVTSSIKPEPGSPLQALLLFLCSFYPLDHSEVQTLIPAIWPPDGRSGLVSGAQAPSWSPTPAEEISLKPTPAPSPSASPRGKAHFPNRLTEPSRSHPTGSRTATLKYNLPGACDHADFQKQAPHPDPKYRVGDKAWEAPS